MINKLGLGGHSFIKELGNDPQASFEEQCAIVTASLDNGIRLIDTTYYQERVALGKVLQTLGRRNEAKIMAWNFFKQPGQENELVNYTPYEADHLELMLDELQTDRIDLLVIHAHPDIEKMKQEMSLAKRWMEQGKVKKVGLGMVQLEHLQRLPTEHPITYVLAPYNAFDQRASAVFLKAREMGIGVIALSPFVRGWKLDAIGKDHADAAGILLRWVTSRQLIDKVIVSMRKQEWVYANLKAVKSGPLKEEEQVMLNSWLNE